MKQALLLLAALVAATGCQKQLDPAPPASTASAPLPPPVSTPSYEPVPAPSTTIAPPSANASGRPVRTQPAAPAAVDPDSAARISAAELQQRLPMGNVIVLDVRNKTAFEMEHAQGAINIPLEEIATRVGELPKDKYVAAYCT